MKLPVSPKDIDAILFDFGGVLFNIDYDLPVQAFKDLGLQNFDEIYTQTAQSGLFDGLEIGTVNKETFVKEIRSHFDKPVSDEQILQAWNVILLDLPKNRLAEVKRLSLKYRTFLLSNTNALHVDEFEKIIDESIGLSDFRNAFEKIYYSNEMGMRKPHREIFDHVCEVNNLIPERTLFLDDTERHVKGAMEAGLHAYHFKVGQDEIYNLFSGW